MTVDLTKARDLVRQLQETLADTPPPIDPGGPSPGAGPGTIVVKAGGSIQAALKAVDAGGTVLVDPGVYSETLVAGDKDLSLKTSTPPTPGRRDPTWNPVTVISPAGQALTIQPAGGRVAVQGLTFRSGDAQQTILEDTGVGTRLDRVAVLGTSGGQHRGISMNGADYVYDSIWVDFCGLPQRDACAVEGWDGTRNGLVNNAYLAGGAQSFFLGGSDSKDESRMPRGVTLLNSDLYKNPAWFGMGWQIKTGLELKAVNGFHMADCRVRYAGVDEGQAGYQMVLTPRNQGGKAPWSAVQNVLIERVACQYGGGGVLIAGPDNVHASGPGRSIILQDVGFFDLDPLGIGMKPPTHPGAGRVVTLSGSPEQVSIQGLTATGKNLQAGLYVIKPSPQLVVKNWKLPPVKYLAKVDAGGQGWDAVRAAMPDAVVAIGITDQGAANLPQF